MLWRRRLTALAYEFPDIELMLLADGSAWSLQPRDGLHATTVLGALSLHKECMWDSSHPGGAARLSIAIGVYIMFYEYFCFHFLAM
uniref:Uncharacterized protein n=1 Tax=Setaria italica TaxID=4555 RepID=K3ZMG6_SETIT